MSSARSSSKLWQLGCWGLQQAGDRLLLAGRALRAGSARQGCVERTGPWQARSPMPARCGAPGRPRTPASCKSRQQHRCRTASNVGAPTVGHSNGQSWQTVNMPSQVYSSGGPLPPSKQVACPLCLCCLRCAARRHSRRRRRGAHSWAAGSGAEVGRSQWPLAAKRFSVPCNSLLTTTSAPNSTTASLS